MVGILAPNIINVKSHQRMVHEPLEKFMKEIYIKATYRAFGKLHLIEQSGTSGKIDYNT